MHKFKWSEYELQRVAKEMYKLMTAGKSAIVEHWPAFKKAQFTANPAYKYSVNFQNTDLMKELRRRVTQLFNAGCVKPVVKEVINPIEAQVKAHGILRKITRAGALWVPPDQNAAPEQLVKSTYQGAILDPTKLRRLRMEDVCDELVEHILPASRTSTPMPPVKPPKDVTKTRKLLTGNVVEELDHRVIITINTTCPKKWVLVDLETGDQYSSPGKPASFYDSPYTRQSWTKPTRRVTIPKPKKQKVN